MKNFSSGGTASRRSRILCVDDEPNVLESLALNLNRRYDVDTATSGAAALELLQSGRSFAVIVSDMRMPGMDGATFLRHARACAPDVVRLLLTGHADLASVASAVNEGRIFRYLTKPCAPSELANAVEAAVEQHRLLTAERELLEKTLHGSIKVLTDMLTLTSPLAFGRANRIKVLVGEISTRLMPAQRWQIEVAGMLSQLYTITLTPETLEKVYWGLALETAEAAAVLRSRQITVDLLSNIPRVEVIHQMLVRHFEVDGRASTSLTVEQESIASMGAAMLRVAMDFDLLEAQGHAAGPALDIMRMKAGRYAPAVLAALAELRATGTEENELRDLPIGALLVGMVFADDVKLVTGALLVPRGQEVTEGVVERLARLRPGACPEPLRMIIPKAPAVGPNSGSPRAPDPSPR